MLYDITHRTTYSYRTDVSVSHHLAHLHPRELPRQQVTDFKMTVDPPPAVMVERTDYYGNATAFFTIGNPHDRLAVTARSRVQVTAPASSRRPPLGTARLLAGAADEPRHEVVQRTERGILRIHHVP